MPAPQTSNRNDASGIVGDNDVMRNEYNGINISNINIQMLLMATKTGECQYYFSYDGNKKSSAFFRGFVNNFV